jgi:hypothetical protein
MWRLRSGAIWVCLVACADSSARLPAIGPAQSPLLDAANAIRRIVIDGRNPALSLKEQPEWTRKMR